MKNEEVVRDAEEGKGREGKGRESKDDKYKKINK